ncbi:MAG TPA: folylpolyglutamate synthase/dihydrofolate synthase family protein [Gemmatimonadaceae bacterium]|nr:folylpolyglutamate synthase/dihydrofolate synthase family protein [Gemmatimonadaceae bacterium]
MDVTLTSYAGALEYLFARVTGGWKLGLDTTRALARAMGDPHERFPSFHVAGTNGKGSAVATLDALLRARGLRVGRYTSPHLVDFRERICVNGAPMSEDAMVESIARWTPEVERVGATFFEATTCIAFEHFAASQVDVAVIEVGLGGRLDSTNIITPLVAGITSIGLDHMQYLGATTELIAAEKAGIFKGGVPAVIGERDPRIRALLARLAREAGASPVRVLAEEAPLEEVTVRGDGTSFTLVDGARRRRLSTPLIGVHQAANAATAIAMLEAAGSPWSAAASDAERALRSVRLAGRFQPWGTFLFDVAHNPDGVGVLCDSLAAVRPPRPIVCLLSVLRDKDWPAMMRALAPHVDRFVLTLPPSVPAERAWSIEEPLALAASCGWAAEGEPDFDRALARAREGAATTLVTGSFHTVGDAMSRLPGSLTAG